MRKMIIKICAAALHSVCLLSPAWAHKASDAYLIFGQDATADAATAFTGSTTALRMQLSLAVKDLDAVIDTLDADGDRSLTWGELKAGTPSILTFINQGVSFSCANTSLSTAWQFASLEQRSDGAYVRLTAPLICDAKSVLAIDYQLFKGVDATQIGRASCRERV